MTRTPLKVCMLVYAFYESDSRVLQYAKALAARGDLVDVIALRREGMPAVEVIDGITVYRIQYRQVNELSRLAYLSRILRFLISAALLLTRKHFSDRYDVIHVHNVPDFLVFAALAPKLMGARIILDIHDILPEFYSSKFGAKTDSFLFKSLVWIERVSIAFSNHVIIANHLWSNRLLSRSCQAPKCSVFINYPDPDLFFPRPKAANGKFLMLYPGTLNFHQGLDVAIRAFSKVADVMPEAQFHIYGEGPTKTALVELRERLGLTGRIVFHDFLPAKEIAEIMAQADLAVVPKRASSRFGNEAASTKIMEFMALGVPVVASRTRIDTYYHDDSMIRFVDSEDDSALADAIQLLANDNKLRQSLSENAFRYVRQHNWKEDGQKYLELMDSLALPQSLPTRHISSESKVNQL